MTDSKLWESNARVAIDQHFEFPRVRYHAGPVGHNPARRGPPNQYLKAKKLQRETASDMKRSEICRPSFPCRFVAQSDPKKSHQTAKMGFGISHTAE
jgi:hypothetical protein